MGCETSVLTGEDIRKLHVSGIPELLRTVSSVGLTERGTPGSQADVTLRGSSFEGVLVLVNGINVRDPQTGHFTMDIPVDIESIERVEILTGGGSTMYGSSAAGGVVNIVTHSAARGLSGSLAAGSYGSAEISAGFGCRDTQPFVSTSRSDISMHLRKGTSDGYSRDTDLANTGADVTGSFRSDTIMVDWNLGVLDKQFGAEDFYAPYQSFEKIRTFLGGVSAQRIAGENSLFRFRLGARRHNDDFILDREKPEGYRNTHINRSFVLSGEYTRALAHSVTVIAGIEGVHTGISSGSLGRHADWNNAVYGECTGEVKRCQVSMSLRFDSGFRDEQCLTYGAGAVYPVGQRSSFRLRAEKSFRSPTYTDLYYNDPANRGNPGLESEQSHSLEAGIDYSHGQTTTGLTVFARKSSNVIDWIRDSGETIWRAENHGLLMTTGVELKTGLTIGGNWNGRVSAMILDQAVDRRKGTESKYVLNTAESTVSGALTGTIPVPLRQSASATSGITVSCMVRYENVRHGDDRMPVTVSCSKTIFSHKDSKTQRKKYTFVVAVRNLFNERYEELPGLRAPGRWVTVRLEYLR